ncbi:MAG: hypothetical protein ACXACB_09225 [Promethearchaeota archaeon]|jgi:hypothetical protein
MEFPIKEIHPTEMCSKSSTTHSDSQEQEETWFTGTLMRSDPTAEKYYYRLSKFHNSITYEETGFNQRFRYNNSVAIRLSEFFPRKWLNEISNTFRITPGEQLGVRCEEDRYSLYLAFIDILLIFRGLTLLDSTLDEINKSLGLNITKNKLRTIRLRLLTLYPSIKQKWCHLRSRTPAKILISTLIKVLNQEFKFDTDSEEDIYKIKHKALEYGYCLSRMKRITRMKRPETWARALCVKACRDTLNRCSSENFPNLTTKDYEVVENKRWQLDKLLKE